MFLLCFEFPSAFGLKSAAQRRSVSANVKRGEASLRSVRSGTLDAVTSVFSEVERCVSGSWDVLEKLGQVDSYSGNDLSLAQSSFFGWCSMVLGHNSHAAVFALCELQVFFSHFDWLSDSAVQLSRPRWRERSGEEFSSSLPGRMVPRAPGPPSEKMVGVGARGV